MEQSPLSQSIRNLEAQLGVKLFQRTTRRTWLTRAGTRFYREARRILRDVDALTTSISSLNGDEPDIVRLALGEDLASEPFTRLMYELEHRQPKVDIEVRELLHAEAARLVRDGGADVAITLNSKAEPELAQTRGWRGLGSNGTQNLCKGCLVGVGAVCGWVSQRSEFAACDGVWQGEGVSAEPIDVFEAKRRQAGHVFLAHVEALGAKLVGVSSGYV